MKKCPYCGCDNINEEKFCLNCGCPIQEEKIQEEE